MKKRIISLALAIAMALTVLAAVGCSEVESRSRIERMIMTLEFYDAEDKVVDTKEVQIKLYVNFAPETTAAFKKLCASGFYDGTCIYNVQGNWLEFGKFSYDAEGNFAETEAYKNASTIKGEFSRNGWVGNKLSTQRGALVMKRDYDDDKIADKKFNTAKGAVIVALGNAATFPADKYCVFGMVCSDDADRNPSSASEDSSVVNRSGLSSYEVLETVKDLRQTDKSTTTYYYDPAVAPGEDGFAKGFYTKTYDEESAAIHYYIGTELTEENELEGEDKDKFIDFLGEQSNYIYNVPYTKVIIKKIVKKG